MFRVAEGAGGLHTARTNFAFIKMFVFPEFPCAQQAAGILLAGGKTGYDRAKLYRLRENG